MKTVLLGDIATIQTGPFGSQLHQKDYVKKGTPIITVEHLGQDRITRQNLPKVSDADKQRLNRYWLEEGDTVFSRVGSVDRASYVHKEEDGWLFSGRCLRVSPDKEKVNPRFLSFLLRSSHFTGYIKSIAVGATMPSINTKLLATAPVTIPAKDEQDFAAEMLDEIERKIELNRRMNETLEKIGQTLFKHYFITNPKAKTWPKVPLEDLFDFLEGPGIRNWQYVNEDGFPFINIRLINNREINLKGASMISFEEANGKYKHFQLQENDLIVSTSGTLGRYAVVRKDHLPLLLNTSVIRFRPSGRTTWQYMYGYLTSSIFLERLEALASGSAQKNFGPMHLRQINVLEPQEGVLKEYSDTTREIYRKSIENLSEITSLVKLRDSLLPRLISGKIKI